MTHGLEARATLNRLPGRPSFTASSSATRFAPSFPARDAVTLFSALPKCGKTTLLAHLLAALPKGEAFCGRALAPGRAVVISEEPAGVWAARRDEIGIPAAAVRVLARNALPRAWRTGASSWASSRSFSTATPRTS
jgi:hypothetical protein